MPNRQLALVSILAIAVPLGCSKPETDTADEGDGDEGEPAGLAGGGVYAGLPTKKVLAVHAAALSTCALVEGGTVRCWGANIEGQLGIGKDPETMLETLVPVEVPGVSKAAKLWAMASYSWGGGHSDGYTDTACAQMADGAMQCWGHNGRVFGDGEYTNQNAPFNNPALAGISSFAAASGHACGVWPDKTVKCWGSNAFGVAGVGNDEYDIKTPTAVVGFTDAASVGVGQNHSCGIKNDGTVWCWGYGSSGQLGNGQTEKVNAPVQVTGLTDASQLAVATNTSCALKNDQSVVCWGEGFASTPTAVDGATSITTIAAQGFMCGLKADKTVVCWGHNSFGQLGDGTRVNRPTQAVAVKGLAGVAQISVGVHHACALLDDGDVQCWGKNGHGQIGDGSLDDRLEPVSVAQLRSETLEPLTELPTALPTDGKVAELTGVPEGCPSKVELDVKVSGKPFPFTVRHIELTWAGQGLGYAIKLRNYDLDEQNSWTMPRGGQGFIAFGLEKWVTEKGEDGQDKLVQKPADKDGVYTTGLLGDYRATNAAGIYDNHKQRFFDTGQITITHLDENWVCGEIDLSHSKDGHALKGKFAAPIPAKNG